MIMTPAENIYHSDYDDVDGLDPVIEQMQEWVTYGSVFEEELNEWHDTLDHVDQDIESRGLDGHVDFLDDSCFAPELPEDWNV